MKRFTMIVALLLLVAVPMMAERVSPETARKVATTFLNNNGAKATQLTDLSKEAGFPNLYIFNGEEGFVVMSADNCVKPILGYSLTGKFVAGGMPENVRWWLKGYNDQIQDAIDSHAKATSEIAKQWENLMAESGNPTKAITVVGPLITTNWDQWYPYNYYCPSCSVYSANGGHALTGCVATAMAQVIKYHNAPVHGIGSHSYTHSTFGQLSVDFSSTNYDWTNMPTQISSSSSSTQIQAVATLIYHCGVAVDMNYGRTSSGAYSTNIAPALKNYFNFSQSTAYHERANYSNSDWISLMRNELNNSRPIVYGGFDDATNPSSGHSFVCDGYDADNYSDLYFHFNWGWSGSYNGYFSIDDMTPGGNGAGGGNHDYTYLQDAVIGIQPSTNTAIPSNLTYSLTGLQNLTLSWTAASGAASYNIYRNNNLVGSTTETTYTETAPFGTNVYWVRSVDANNEISLSSNTVTVTIAYQTPVVNDLGASLSGNNIDLTWTAPNWCYPEIPTEVLNYGQGSVYYSWTYKYYAHRYLAADLAQYADKAVYKISTYIQYPGTYSLFIYSKSNTSNQPDASSLGANINQVSISVSNSWFDFDLPTSIILTGTDDLWVVLKQENTGQEYPVPSFNLSEYNQNACYKSSSSPTSLSSVSSNYQISWFINTYLTDGTYTYNLYDGTSTVANNIQSTSYTVSDIANNAAHQYTVKTNYYDGESDASNMAGLTLGTASLSALALGDNDKMTVTEGSTLTVSGTLSNSVNANLILEDGAQLIHNTAGVKATVKKDIAAYTADDNGWYFIASPVTESITPSEDNGLLANDFDLYKFDQSEAQEWRNYESTSHPFSTLDHKTGYLYANSGNPTLTFAGTLAAITDPTALTYDGNATFKGFNLIGNPYPCNTTVNKDFYVISGNTVTLAESGRQITPCEGIFVKATGENESVTFTKATASAKGTGSKDCFDVVVTQDRATLDRARVRLGEGIGMEKFTLDDSHTQISLWQDGQQFAVAYANGQSELPLNFKATRNGSYTLTFEIDNLDLDYLHLIDNRTGDDVDLLALRQAQGPASYTFEAKTTDYASRFKLVFSNCEDAVGDNTTFAYVNNGNIVVNKEGTLQIVDMTGRVIVSRSGRIQCVATAGMTPGVYVLRLITADGVKTQKIVIE